MRKNNNNNNTIIPSERDKTSLDLEKNRALFTMPIHNSLSFRKCSQSQAFVVIFRLLFLQRAFQDEQPRRSSGDGSDAAHSPPSPGFGVAVASSESSPLAFDGSAPPSDVLDLDLDPDNQREVAATSDDDVGEAHAHRSGDVQKVQSEWCCRRRRCCCGCCCRYVRNGSGQSCTIYKCC